MSWQQIITPNLTISYTGGWCLQAVQNAFGTAHPYSSAMQDWLSGENGHGNHDGELPPAGVYVPVYFSLGDEPRGHIAISMPNGWVASSTLPGVNKGLYIHPSLAALISMYAKYNEGCHYLGWSEGVGNEAVVQFLPTTADPGGGQDVTQEQFDQYKIEAAKNTVRLLADVVAGDPQYETTQPKVFEADVARLLGATQPLEDRRLGHDMWNDYGCKRKDEWQPEHDKLQQQLDADDQTVTEQLKELSDAQFKNKELKKELTDAQTAATTDQAPQPAVDTTAVINAALAPYRANPWPLVVEWVKTIFKGGD